MYNIISIIQLKLYFLLGPCRAVNTCQGPWSFSRYFRDKFIARGIATNIAQLRKKLVMALPSLWCIYTFFY